MDGEALGRLILAVVMTASGVLLIWQARAGAAGRLGRNAFAGIRTADTQASDEAWRAAHVRAEKPNALAGVVALAVGVQALLPTSTVFFFAVVMAGSALMAGLVLYAARVGSAAARRVSSAGAGASD
jgi:uncharacterized membrane protein